MTAALKDLTPKAARHWFIKSHPSYRTYCDGLLCKGDNS